MYSSYSLALFIQGITQENFVMQLKSSKRPKWLADRNCLDSFTARCDESRRVQEFILLCSSERVLQVLHIQELFPNSHLLRQLLFLHNNLFRLNILNSLHLFHRFFIFTIITHAARFIFRPVGFGKERPLFIAWTFWTCFRFSSRWTVTAWPTTAAISVFLFPLVFSEIGSFPHFSAFWAFLFSDIIPFVHKVWK